MTRATTRAVIGSASGMVLVAGFAGFMILLAPKPQKLPAPEQGRITFAAQHLPSIALPDGRQEVLRSVLNVRKPMRYGDFVWNDDAVPGGPVWVRVDLKRQTLSVFRDGHEIGTAVILYGTDGSPTPTGQFKVMEMAETHRSNLYDASMPYMLRLTNDGIAIHAADVQQGSATHGCIGIPIAFASRLFAQMDLGDTVLIMGTEKANAA